jgi:three-Cys-motif partner protein
MSVPNETLWEIELHTKAKHEILRRYLGAWFGIMGRTNPRIIYLDGFCGPGRYKSGEEGSPIIALKIALDHNYRKNLNKVTFVFVEEREDRINHLRSEIASLTLPNTFDVLIEQNQFENTLTAILDNLDKKSGKIAPTFAFIDPFGFKGAPYELVKRILSNHKTEIFINIMADSVNRFLEHPDPQITKHVVELFGTDQVLQILHGNGDRVRSLRELYQSQLGKCASFVKYFEMRDEHFRVIYYLFFATNNPLGFVKMKEAFWKVDCSNGYSFSDATDPNQPVLFYDDPTINLADGICRKFAGKKMTVGNIKRYVEIETPYIESQMKKALCYLELKGRINVEAIKVDGKKRRKCTFPDDVVVILEF